MTKYSQG